MPPDSPAQPMDPALQRRGMRMMVWEGVSALTLIALLQGNFLAGFLLHLGASPLEVGLGTSLPLLATLAQMPGAILVYRLRRLIPSMSLIFGLHRLLWSAAGLLALWAPRGSALGIYLPLYFLSFSLAAAGNPAWQSMSAELVPTRRRGRYFGRRGAVLQVVNVVATLAAGAALDFWGQDTGFFILYSLALVLSVINFVQLRLHPEPPRQLAADRGGFWAPWRQRDFRAIMLVFAAWNFCQSLANPYFAVRMIRDLQLPYTVMSALATGAGLAAALVLYFWGRWIDRAGEDRVVAATLPLMALVPFGWLLAAWGGVSWLALLHVVQAICLGGLQITFFTLSMRLAPPTGRAFYLAQFTAAGGLVGGLAPLLAGWLAGESLPPHWRLGALHGDRLDSIFWLAGVLSLAFALWWLRRVRRRGPAAVRAA